MSLPLSIGAESYSQVPDLSCLATFDDGSECNSMDSEHVTNVEVNVSSIIQGYLSFILPPIRSRELLQHNGGF